MNEVKVGYQPFNSKLITQVEKDSEIVANRLGGYDASEWHFLRSEITGQVGADPRLLDLLSESGIGYNVYSRSILAPAYSEAGLFGGSVSIASSGVNNESGVILSKH